jgi:hypothetical protein
MAIARVARLLALLCAQQLPAGQNPTNQLRMLIQIPSRRICEAASSICLSAAKTASLEEPC